MGIRNIVKDVSILNAKAATWIGSNVWVWDFRNAIFSFATDGGGTAALTVKFQWAISAEAPDFAAAQSKTNMWDYIEVIDLQSGSAIDWDTGVSVATADDYRLFEANVNGLTWVNAVVTARSAWSVNVKATLFSND